MAKPDELPASSTFASFLESGIDRCAFISAWLRARDIRHSVVELAGKRHIVVRFDDGAYDPRFRMKTLVAHHDRADGTQGANDNSAACFQLMLLAERLSRDRATGSQDDRAPLVHNIRIFFTDGEEAAGAKGIAYQGAFALGSGLRKLKMTEDDVFVFDCTGRGDTLVVSTAGMERQGAFGRRLADLHERTVRLAREVAPESWLRLPTPYSDNAGFLASGIASQVITVLPRIEATALLAASDSLGTSGKRRLGDMLARHGRVETNRVETDRVGIGTVTDGGSRVEGYRAKGELAGALPETWALMHTERDSAASLTASAFRLMESFLLALAELKESAV